MFIQSVATIPPAQPLGRVAIDRLASDSMPIVASPSAKYEAPNVVVEFPQTTQLKNAVGKFNDVMRQSKQNLEFSVDTETKKPIIKLVDTVTGDVIRQIPTEEMLAITRSIDHFQQGLLLKQKA